MASLRISSSSSKALGVFMLSLAAVNFTSCRSKLEVTSKSGAALPAVVDSTADSARRDYYQSSSVIRLSISRELLAEGDSLTLSNESTGATLLDHQTIDPSALALSEPEYSIQENEEEFVLAIYPRSPDMAGKLVFGANKLRFEVGNDSWEQEIFLQDFPLMGTVNGYFGDDHQSESGYRGAFPGVVHSIVKAEAADGRKLMLRTGFFSILNH